MYRKFAYILFTVFCGICVIAAQYETVTNRNPDAGESYGRLLSDAYRVILNHEKQIGTFSNVGFFNSQVKNVINMYNPRPLTTGGMINNVKKRLELRMQRFELERFMNGYAGRIAGSDVAMMHAAFDCRVKNIQINVRMDKKCQQIFNKHKQQADSKVGQYLSNNSNHNMQQGMTQPQPTQPVVQTPPQQINTKDTIDTIIKNDMAKSPSHPVATVDKKNNTIHIQDTAPNNQLDKKIGLPTPVPTPMPMPMPMPMPIPVPQSNHENNIQKFNPLKSIHPSLKKQNFGIKPTSSLTVSENDIGQPHYDSHSDFDPVTTASINQVAPQNLEIPFIEGLVVTSQGNDNINHISELIKQGHYKTVTIIGHANQGNDNVADMQMSLKRAIYISNMIQKHNPNIIISLTAMGAKNPLAGTSKYDNRNRRAEIFLN
jgi:outer membrane protein OmpA-like peptidoglycan-associated protein